MTIRSAKDALVVFCADHGEMLGERGTWYKQTFYEWSARVPLVARWPGRVKPGRSNAACSLVDLLPTFLDAAAGESGARVAPVDPVAGASLLPEPEARDVTSEYSSEGVSAPSRMLRRGPWKYVQTRGLPPLLFDLIADPQELDDLAGRPSHAKVEAELRERLLADWDPDAVHERILASQRRRLFLRELALRQGRFPDWTYEAPRRPRPLRAPCYRRGCRRSQAAIALSLRYSHAAPEDLAGVLQFARRHAATESAGRR